MKPASGKVATTGQIDHGAFLADHRSGSDLHAGRYDVKTTAVDECRAQVHRGGRVLVGDSVRSAPKGNVEAGRAGGGETAAFEGDDRTG